MDEIKVGIVAYPDRKFLVMRYRDPFTGKHVARSTGTADRTEAEKAAGKWEAELREGRYAVPLKMTWEQFRERYENEVVIGLAKETDQKILHILNTLERIINPTRLKDMTFERLSYFQAKLRDKKLSENTIKSYLAHIGAALRWAVRMGLLPRHRRSRCRDGPRGQR